TRLLSIMRQSPIPDHHLVIGPPIYARRGSQRSAICAGRLQKSAGTGFASGRATQSHRGDRMDVVANIGPSIRIRGDITAQEPLTIAGHVVGHIDVSGYRLVVTEAAHVKADIVAHTLVIGGFVTGRVSAEGRVVVQPTATVEGEMTAPTLSVSDGAQLQAKFQIVGKRAGAATS